MLIAIDGPAASGKGTVARMLAKEFGLQYLDTGKLYRAVGYNLLVTKINPSLEVLDKILSTSKSYIKNLKLNQLLNPELETEEVGAYASFVSAIPEIRHDLFNLQKQVANNSEGAVLDGRDIGTVICPNADFKFFITADAKIRANRRFKQLISANKDVKEADILRDIEARDFRDANRKIAPLKPASDAYVIDSSNISPEEVFFKIKELILKAKNS
jgi:cytidylate kinase